MRRWSAASAGLATALVLAACGIPTDARPRPLPEDDIPFGLLEPTLPSRRVTPSPPATATAEIYLVAGDRLVAVPRQLTAPVSLDAVLAALLVGPTAEEAAAGRRSAIGPATRLRSALSADGTADVDLSESFAAVAGEEQILALAQLVFTATALPGVRNVSFRLDGSPVEVPTADGTLKKAPVDRADFAVLGPP